MLKAREMFFFKTTKPLENMPANYKSTRELKAQKSFIKY